MKQYTREQDNFDAIPFMLVSNQDHRTPVSAAIGGYYVSKVDETKKDDEIGKYYFDIGRGIIVGVGNGWYDFYLGKHEWYHGPILISIPGMGGVSGYDPVYFRIEGVRAIEIAPSDQNDSYIMTFAMVSSTDHVSLMPNLTPTIMVSRDGSEFEDITVNPPFQFGRGFYGLKTWPNPNEPGSEHNNECIYMLKATAVGADTTYESFQVFRYDYPA